MKFYGEIIGDNDIVTKEYVIEKVGEALPLTGGTVTGNVIMDSGGNFVTELSTSTGRDITFTNKRFNAFSAIARAGKGIIIYTTDEQGNIGGQIMILDDRVLISTTGTSPFRVDSDGVIVPDPTMNSNPATKKYVDDGLSTKQGVLTAGDGINITANTISFRLQDNTTTAIYKLGVDNGLLYIEEL